MSGTTKTSDVVRDLPAEPKAQLWALLLRIKELRSLQEMKRPVSIHWPQTELEFAEICEELAALTPPREMWKVLTLLAMQAACDFGTDLEDGSYGEE